MTLFHLTYILYYHAIAFCQAGSRAYGLTKGRNQVECQKIFCLASGHKPNNHAPRYLGDSYRPTAASNENGRPRRASPPWVILRPKSCPLGLETHHSCRSQTLIVARLSASPRPSGT